MMRSSIFLLSIIFWIWTNSFFAKPSSFERHQGDKLQPNRKSRYALISNFKQCKNPTWRQKYHENEKKHRKVNHYNEKCHKDCCKRKSSTRDFKMKFFADIYDYSPITYDDVTLTKFSEIFTIESYVYPPKYPNTLPYSSTLRPPTPPRPTPPPPPRPTPPPPPPTTTRPPTTRPPPTMPPTTRPPPTMPPTTKPPTTKPPTTKPPTTIPPTTKPPPTILTPTKPPTTKPPITIPTTTKPPTTRPPTTIPPTTRRP